MDRLYSPLESKNCTMSSFVCRLNIQQQAGAGSCPYIQESVGGPPPEQVPMSSCAVWQSIKIKTGQSNQPFLLSLSFFSNIFSNPPDMSVSSVPTADTHMKRYYIYLPDRRTGHTRNLSLKDDHPRWMEAARQPFSPFTLTPRHVRSVFHIYGLLYFFPLLSRRWVGWIYYIISPPQWQISFFVSSFTFDDKKIWRKVVIIQSSLSVCSFVWLPSL